MQIASMGIEEGGDARTINLCQRCYNEKLVQQGKQSLKSKEWREVVERKAHRRRLWKNLRKRIIPSRNVVYFTLQRAWPRKILADAAQEKQEGHGQWQQEPHFNKFLEQVKKKCGYRLQCPHDAHGVQCKDVGQLVKASDRNAGKKEAL